MYFFGIIVFQLEIEWLQKPKKKICARMGATSEEIRIKKDKILIDFHATSWENLQDYFFEYV